MKTSATSLLTMSKQSSGKCKLLFGFAVALLAPNLAFAGGTDFLCFFHEQMKMIIGVAIAVAAGFWALEHLFGIAKLHDWVMKVAMVCMVVVGVTIMIAKTGLSSGCLV